MRLTHDRVSMVHEMARTRQAPIPLAMGMFGAAIGALRTQRADDSVIRGEDQERSIVMEHRVVRPAQRHGMVVMASVILLLTLILPGAPPAQAQIAAPASVGEAIVEGRVRTSRGAGVPGITITAYPSGRRATTDDQGAYRLSLPAGWTVLTPGVGATNEYRPLARMLRVTSRGARVDFTVHDRPASHLAIMGRIGIVEADMAPLGGVPVQCGRQTARTVADGLYLCLVPLTQAPVVVSPIAPPRTSIIAFIPATATFTTAGVHEASFAATFFAYRVEGRVWHRPGIPLGRADLTFRVRYGTTVVERTVRADEEGRFAIDRIPPGEARVTIAANQMRPQTITLFVDEDMTDVAIVLRR